MSGIREKAAWSLAAALALFIVGALTGVIEGGDLDPSEPPAPTDSVKLPGTAISSLPYVISAPGSYYVTRDLTAGGAGDDGITVNASGVSVDLGGFTLSGAPGTDDGIVVTGFRTNVSIRNGALAGWGGDGIDAEFATTGMIEGVTVQDTGANGVRAGKHMLVRGCVVTGAGASGVVIDSHSQVIECEAIANADSGIRATGIFTQVRDSLATQNGGDGILVEALNSTVSGNVASNNGAVNGAGIHIIANSCYVYDNSVINNDRGIELDASFNTVVRNNVQFNTVNFEAVASNIVGPVVNSATVATSSNPHANYTP